MLLAVSLLLIAAGCWLLLGGGARRAGRGFVALRPDRRAWLHGPGLVEPADFLRLGALVISGHPGRSVGRLVLGEGPDARTVYLKREEGAGWVTRLRNFLAGFGWVSRSVREARVLAGLERDGLPAPRWLATGEDGRGGAFLLLEEVPGAVPLGAALRAAPPGGRRDLAARLGRLLARLHAAGFFHRDLYAKHVLVQQPSGDLYLLDWQRATRGAVAARASRVRDLACLRATLADDLAGPRECLACLRAYLGGAASRPALRRLAAEVEALARRLREHRHVREKRQGPADARQAWVVLDGEALAVTPTLVEWAGEGGLDWLDLRRQPLGPEPVSRRWLVLPGGRPALLVRRRDRLSRTGELWRRFTGRTHRASELRQSTLLWRLERHSVAAPRVLAVGQRRASSRRVDSFLLTAPLEGTVRLTTWLTRATPEGRRGVVAELGEVVARMHEACCYLGGAAESGLAVQVGTAGPMPVLANVEGITPRRRPRPGRARADLRRLAALLSRAGAGPEDWQALLARYDARAGGARTAVPLPAPAPARPAAPRTGSLWRRVVFGERRVVQRADWADFAGDDWLDGVMQLEVTDRFSAKQGRSTGRLVLQARDGSGRRLVVYLKRHYRLRFRDGWLAALWPGGGWSPAMQEHAHLEWARSQGVPVPATVAAGELVGPWGRLQSFLAVEELTDMLPLHEAVPLAAATLAPDGFRRWKRGLVVEMARLARLLHDRRHFHKDLYLCHFYVHRDDLARPVAPAEWRGRVYLIDLHRLAHQPWTWWLAQLKDLAQLLYSSEVPGVDARDQVAFWAAYRGPGAGGWWERLLRRLVRFKWRLYRKHNLRRKGRA